MKRLTVIGIAVIMSVMSLQAQIIEERQQADTSSVKARTAVVEGDRMNRGIPETPLKSLSGQVAGVNVSTDGSERMAMLNSVRVRGTTSITGGNDPLVIIDGISSDLATLSTIFPADIASFTVLKNASETAQYGSRGASGVIVVNTKRGNAQKFSISYDGHFGVESIYKSLQMLGPEEYLSTAGALGLNVKDFGYRTYYPDIVTRPGLVHNHHLAFSGGNETSNYRASIGYADRNNVIKGYGDENLVAKLNINQKAFGDLLSIDFGMFGSSHKIRDLFDYQMMFYSAATQNPTCPTGDAAYENWVKNNTAAYINHPEILLEEKNDEKGLNFNTHLKLGFDFTKDFRLVVFGAYSYSSVENAEFCPTWVWAQGQAFRKEAKTENILGNATLSYRHSWGAHQLKASLLGEYQRVAGSWFQTRVSGFTSNHFHYENIGAATSRPYGETQSFSDNSALASVMSSLSYSYDDRYSVTLTTRADGSSMVGDMHTWGFFPSVSASWNIKNEGFLKDVSAVSQMNINAGYGRSGNLGGISPFSTMELMLPGEVVPYEGSSTITLNRMRNTNPDLEWEMRSTFNVGASMGFWKNRLALTLEYYYSKTTDMLYQYDVPVPPFKYDKLLANIGSMSNSGVETGIIVTPLLKDDMELNISLNLAWQKNRLLSLSGEYRGMQMSAADIVPVGSLIGAGMNGGNNNILYQIVGQPLGVFYLPHCTGLRVDENGNYKYDIKDKNDDGSIDMSDGGDRYIAGQATPKVTLGSNINFRWKDLDVSVQINGAFGHKIYNGTSLAYMNMSNFPDYNVLKEAPARKIVDQNVTDYWLERGDYVNIDYLTVGYNIPVKARYVSSLRVSASIDNLATITGYSGLTPMINSYVFNRTMGIDDKRSYPVSRTYSLGLSIRF
ncbi:MAG: SusC/RagA family TonB-linked outer membrane protein [Bacteroidales bacterium]|nr:SusC/RagA family TonB-linked outer membrane protein [Bacteroidales bacterium]